jgi:hypothetical protein
MRWPPIAVALAICLLAPASATAEENPANEPPFGGETPPPLVEPTSLTTPPPDFEVSGSEAIAAAAATDVVRDELAETPDAKPKPYVRGDRWQVSYYAPDGTQVAQVILDGRTGAVDEAWGDQQVETKLARGYSGAIAQKVNAPYVWIPLCVLFLAPFFEPRRPLRLIHLDLLVVIGLSLSLLFFNRAEIDASVALTYPVLGYFLVRMLVAGLWPRARPGPLVPFASARLLLVGLVVLLAARAVLNVVDSHAIDVGVAGVIGADHITNGVPLYEGTFPSVIERGDVYGPANYLAYVPFELIFPWHGTWDDVAAAHAAAIVFDLLAAVGLVALGRRLRPGADGRLLGLALGFAWAACPWTLYTMNANANDGLIAALGVGALLALGSPAGRGVMVALAAAAKFGSAALAPLFATADGERRRRSTLIFSVAFIAACAIVVVPFLPDGGVREFYDRTLGYQASRGSPFSVWGLAPSLDFLQPVARALAVALAFAVAFYPRFKTPVQIAALACAVTIAVQLTANHWFYFYVVWFLPFALVASFASQREVSPRSGSRAARVAAS